MLLGHVHRLQQLEDAKGQRIGQWFLDDPRSESSEGLPGLHEHLHLFEDTLLRYGMIRKDITLNLSSDNLKGMSDRCADHS